MSAGLPAGSLISQGVRAYFAAVDRTNGVALAFDPAAQGRFALNAPPTGWISAGLLHAFERKPAAQLLPVLSGSPAVVKTQARASVQETVQCTFPAWSRLAMALSAGVQTLNLLRTATNGSPAASGGAAAAAEVVLAGSTATSLHLSTATAVSAGDVVVVDADYGGETGYLGSGAPGTYVAAAPAVADVDFVRRISFNVARVLSVNAGVVTLASPLPGGAPTTAMKVSVVEGFCDRNGGAFVPEWSALLVWDGVQGDRLILHYPRLQPAGDSAAEVQAEMAKGVHGLRPSASFRAMPVTDANGGVPAVSFRTYLPAPMRLV